MDLVRLRKSFQRSDREYVNSVLLEVSNKLVEVLQVKEVDSVRAYKVDEFAALLLTPAIVEEARKKFSFDAKITTPR